jgi:hypothetical protein
VLISNAVITRPMSKKKHENNVHSIISTVIYTTLPFEDRTAKKCPYEHSETQNTNILR